MFSIGMMGCAFKEQVNDDYLICNQTSNGSMAETEDGYFFAYNGILYYADKNNMELWLPVCNKPDCLHRDKNCNAYIPTNNVITQNNGKIYGLDYVAVEKPYVYEIAMDGSGLKNIYDIPLDVNPDGYSVALFQDQYVINYSYLDEYGIYQEHIISLEDDKKKNAVISNLYSGTDNTTILSGNQYWSIRGDNLILATIKLAEGTDAMRNFCKIENEEIIPLNLPEEINALGGYMKGDVFTYYQEQEGFYKYNIKTGEKEFICENQLEDGRGYILNDTYMFESNKYMNYLPEEAYLKIYNGKEWIDVELLKEISKYERDSFVPTCVTLDRMFFRRSHKWSDGTITVYLYYMMLDEEHPKLVKASTFGAEEKEDDELLTEEEDTSVYAKFEEVVVFDNEKYLLKITDMYLDYSNNFCVDIYAENKSKDKIYHFTAPHWTINGIQCDIEWGSSSIGSNSTYKNTIKFNNSLMGCNKFVDYYRSTEYTDIQVCFYSLQDRKGEMDKLLEKESIRIYPQGEENITHFSREPKESDIELVNNEDVSVIITEYDENFVSNDIINVIIQNKTEESFVVKVEEASANGIAVIPNIYFGTYWTIVNPGAVVLYPMTLFDDEKQYALEVPARMEPSSAFFDRSHITSIEEIEMKLRIMEYNPITGYDEENNIVYETFVLNP